MLLPNAMAALDADKIVQLLETKFTPIDMNHDGTPDVSRTFDGGEMIRASYSFPMTAPGTEEVWRLSPTRTSTELTVYKQKIAISKVIEHYSDETRDAILSIETYWKSGNETTLDLRIIDDFVGGNRVSEKSQLINGNWQRIGREIFPIEADGADTSGRNEYAQCLNTAAANPTTCVACMNTLKTAIDGSVNNLITSVPLSQRCEDDNFLYFGEGLRADKNKCLPPSNCSTSCTCTPAPSMPCPPCSDPAFAKCQSDHTLQQANVRTRLNEAMEPFRNMIKCLNQKNPKLVAKLLKNLIQKRPIIDCVNHPGATASMRRLLPPSGLSESAAIQLGRSTGGFYYSAHPNRLFLTADSPTMSSNTAHMGETIFHELIHSAGLPGNHNHNDSKSADFAKDAVYGCEMLCATTPSVQIQRQRKKIDGCNACFKAEGNTGSGAAAECTSANGWN
ncbi:MAG: hypothetical protein A2X86_21310 [Bdellovibrionales bacterium GWA2_49_15]|nr:MAG: hypothetical protein A2X86_21310 [Bdellovibrionales bacterium GWA2_49_15]HAZ14918.1 hypothetical protein [Bdellovibrionales bacterium]